MKLSLLFFVLFCPLLMQAQSGDMRVYTVAGGPISGPVGDGGPATAAYIDNTEGIWVDASCNIYFSEMAPNKRIRKVDGTTGIISTLAGNGNWGFSGDGGPATAAEVNVAYGLYCDAAGNVFFADEGNKRVRRVDATTGTIKTIAGGGISTSDGVMATNAQLGLTYNVYGDIYGNIYIAEGSKIRKVNSSGIITTIAGTGISDFYGDGGPATNAAICLGTAGMIIDGAGNLYFADRTNARVRKISGATGIITTVAGTTDGFSGDGGQATAAQLSGPISIFLDRVGNLIIGDNQNERIRKVDITTGIITTIAGNGGLGFASDGTLATSATIHPEFIYLDLDGNIYFSTYGYKVYKITNYIPGLAVSGSNCTKTNAVPGLEAESANIELYPNPATTQLHITLPNTTYTTLTITNHIGQLMLQQVVSNKNIDVDLRHYPQGLYLLRAADQQGNTTVKKFLKE